MESLKELEVSLKKAMADIRGMDSKFSVQEGNIKGLESRKIDLEKEITELQAKKAELVSFLGSAQSNLNKEHEAKMRDLATKHDALDGDRGKIRGLEIQAELSKKAADESKEKYDKLYAEYSSKLADLKSKQEQLSAVKF